MSNRANKPLPKPSEAFRNAFDSSTSGCLRTCECGITYFDGFNRWDWEEGELEELRKQAKAQPTKYLEIDCAVSSYEVEGREFVWDCPCNGGTRYERWILMHARRILRFLEAHAEELEEQAKAVKPSKELLARESFRPSKPPDDSSVGKRLITL